MGTLRRATRGFKDYHVHFQEGVELSSPAQVEEIFL